MGNKVFEPDLDEVYDYFQELAEDERYKFESREASMELTKRLSRTPIHALNHLFFDMRDKGYLEHVEMTDLASRSFEFAITCLDGDEKLDFSAEDLEKDLDGSYHDNQVSHTRRVG